MQGDFVDSYRNLTLKAVMALKWATTHCKNAAFFLKSDDDALVNIFEWTQKAETAALDHSRLIMCALWRTNTMPILRDPNTCLKWCVKFDEFPGRKLFPQYCSGIALTMSRDIMSEMYRAAVKTPFFWIDDVFLTGLVAGKLKDVFYVDVMRNFKNTNVAMKQFSSSTKQPTVLVSHERNADRFNELWMLILRRHQMSGLRSTGNNTTLTNESG